MSIQTKKNFKILSVLFLAVLLSFSFITFFQTRATSSTYIKLRLNVVKNYDQSFSFSISKYDFLNGIYDTPQIYDFSEPVETTNGIKMILNVYTASALTPSVKYILPSSRFLTLDAENENSEADGGIQEKSAGQTEFAIPYDLENPITSIGIVVGTNETKFQIPAWCHTFNNDLQLDDVDDSKNGEVTFLQQILSKLGYYEANEEGAFGNATQDAVIAFQIANNITPTGFFGPVARSRINSLHGCNVGSPILAGIAISNPANKINYALGESLDISGLEVTGYYINGDPEVLPITAENILGFNNSAEGKNVLTISYQNFAASYDVYFSNPVLPTSISLNNFVPNMVVSDSIDVTATILPTNCTIAKIDWISNNPEIVSISTDSYSKATISALKDGSVTITATVHGTNIKATSNIVVSPHISVVGINLNESSKIINVGSTSQLIATVQPINATDKRILWSSDNFSVATVNANGLVTAVGQGQAKITASTYEGNFQAIFLVTVPQEQKVIGVYLDMLSGTMGLGASRKIVAMILPATATNKKVNWSSGNSDIISITQDGTATGLALGTAKITATTVDGNFSATANISVIPMSGSSGGGGGGGIPSPVNAECGSAAGEATEKPTTNLCKDESTPEVRGTGPWIWECLGLNGGSSVDCAADVGAAIWEGTEDNDWANGANWSSGQPPAVGQNAIIPVGTTFFPIISADYPTAFDQLIQLGGGFICDGGALHNTGGFTCEGGTYYLTNAACFSDGGAMTIGSGCSIVFSPYMSANKSPLKNIAGTITNFFASIANVIWSSTAGLLYSIFK